MSNTYLSPNPSIPIVGPVGATDIRTVQTAKLMFALSNGTIWGPPHPASPMMDVYFNDVPIQNPDGSFNFNGVAMTMNPGTLTQSPLTGFSDTESLTGSGAQITFASPQTISIPNGGPGAVRLNITLPALYNQDTGNGNMNGDSVTLKFEVSNNGGAYQDMTGLVDGAGQGTISGMSTGTVAKGFLIPLYSTGTGPWQVRITRVTADNGTAYRVNATYLQSYAIITNQALIYPMTAVLGVSLDAARFGSIPKVSMRCKGIMVKVPANYTPATKGAFSMGTSIFTTASIAVNGPAGTFTRSSGSYLTDGFAPGQNITTAGFANAGNCGNYVINTVTATVITVTNVTGLVTETSAAGRTVYTNAAPILAVDGVGKTFTRTIGSFLADGFAVGMNVVTSGFTNTGNNGTFAITSLTATVMTFSGATSLVTEGASTGRQIVSAWVPAVYATSGPGTTGGAWDGTFQTLWTSNPAWIFMDMATNPLYGAGKYLAQSGINKWVLYTLAQYCDAMVSDGFGGVEPRFSFNGYLTSRDEAFKVLAHIISSARAQLYYGGGQATPVQDTDRAPVMLYTPSNVKNGTFSYQGTARKARHTVCNVYWNDPAQNWALVPETVSADDVSILRYGVQGTTVTAVGATTKGQARRFGRWLLLSELNETEGVTFTTGLEGIVARPGDIVLIQDPGRKRVRQGGRTLAGCTTTTVNLDSTVTLAAGTYTLYVQLQDGSLGSATVTTGTGTWSTLTVGTAFASAPLPYAQWLLTSTNVTATRWAVVGVKENQSSTEKSYTITAVANYEPKYALADATDSLVARATSAPGTFAAPGTITPTSSTSKAQADRLIYTLTAYWAPPSVGTPTGYTAQYQKDNGVWVDMIVTGCSATMVDVQTGTYNVRVAANYPGGTSPFAIYSGFAIANAGGSPAELANTAALTAQNLAYASLAGNAAPIPNFDQPLATIWPYMTQIAAASAPTGCPTPFCGRSQQRDTQPTTTFAVTPGNQYLVSAWIDTTQTSYPAQFGISWLNAAGGQISLSWTAQAPAGTPWASYSAALTAPVGATHAQVDCVVLGTSGFGSTYFTGLQVDSGTAAQIAAALAQTGVNSMSTPDILAKGQKNAEITDYNMLVQVQVGSGTTSSPSAGSLDAQANTAGVSHAAFDTAVANLAAFLNGLSPSWTDQTQDTPLGAGGGATLTSLWAATATAETALWNSITSTITAANASTLLGSTWASPGAIGSTTPNTGAFTTLAASGQLNANGGVQTTGITSTSGFINLNNVSLSTQLVNNGTSFKLYDITNSMAVWTYTPTPTSTFNLSASLAVSMGALTVNPTSGTPLTVKYNGTTVATVSSTGLAVTGTGGFTNLLTASSGVNANGVNIGTVSANRIDSTSYTAINAASGQQVYLNWNLGGGVTFGNGAGSSVATMSTAGALTLNAGISATTGTFSGAISGNSLTTAGAGYTIGHGGTNWYMQVANTTSLGFIAMGVDNSNNYCYITTTATSGYNFNGQAISAVGSFAATTGAFSGNVTVGSLAGFTTPSLSSSYGTPWTNLVATKADGVTELGKYLDFHESASDGVDYSARLTSSSGNILFTGGISATTGTFSSTVQLAGNGIKVNWYSAGYENWYAGMGASATAFIIGSGTTPNILQLNNTGSAFFIGGISATTGTFSLATVYSNNTTYFVGSSIFLNSSVLTYAAGPFGHQFNNNANSLALVSIANSGLLTANYGISTTTGSFSGTLTANSGASSAQAIFANCNTLTSGYGVNFTGVATAGTQSILMVGQSGYSNGFTVQYVNGTGMVYTMNNGNLTVGGNLSAGAGTFSGLLSTTNQVQWTGNSSSTGYLQGTSTDTRWVSTTNLNLYANSGTQSAILSSSGFTLNTGLTATTGIFTTQLTVGQAAAGDSIFQVYSASLGGLRIGYNSTAVNYLDSGTLNLRNATGSTTFGTLTTSGMAFTVALSSTVQRLGLGTYNANDSATFAIRNAYGVSFGRVYNSADAPAGGAYFNYMLLPESPGNSSQSILALGEGTDSWIGYGAWNAAPTWAKIYTSSNINNQVAALQALNSMVNAPFSCTMATVPLATDPRFSTPGFYGYIYVTDDTSADGKAGTLYQSNGTSWVLKGASALVAGRITAGNITAGSIGTAALATQLALVGQYISSAAFTSGGTGYSTWGVPGAANVAAATGAASGFALYASGISTYCNNGWPNVSGGTSPGWTNPTVMLEIGGTSSASLNGYDLNTLALGKLVNGGTQFYTGNATWVCPPGIYWLEVMVVAPGGGAALNTSTGRGGGGGAGASLVATIQVNPGTSYSIAIGSVGAGAMSSSGGTGGNGGNAVFSGAAGGSAPAINITCTGGIGGSCSAGASSGGASGSASMNSVTAVASATGGSSPQNSNNATAIVYSFACSGSAGAYYYSSTTLNSGSAPGFAGINSGGGNSGFGTGGTGVTTPGYGGGGGFNNGASSSQAGGSGCIRLRY